MQEVTSVMSANALCRLARPITEVLLTLHGCETMLEVAAGHGFIHVLGDSTDAARS